MPALVTYSSKGKRKRKSVVALPEDEASEVAVEDIVDEPPAGDDARKKRRRKRNRDGDKQADAANANANAAGAVEADVAGGDAAASISSAGAAAKKRKKRPDKGKGREVAPEDIPIDPSLAAPAPAPAAGSSIPLTAPAPAPTAQFPYFSPYTFTTDPAHPIPSFLTDGMPALPPPPPPPADGSFAGLQTNEDVLRALQEFDVSKLADVLRQFGQQQQQQQQQQSQGEGAAAPQQIQIGEPAPVTAGGAALPSAFVMGPPLHEPPRPRAFTAAPLPATSENPEHAQLLCSKWLDPTKLKILVETQGLVYKKGKFSNTEEEQVRQAIEEYRNMHELTNEQITEKIFAKGIKDRDNAFWSEITSHVPLRPIIAVYHYVRRAYHPMKHQGKWTPEEDGVLRQAVAECGQSWEKVSARVGRMAADCRDRWRNHINHEENRTIGPWTKEEEELLTKIVTEMTIDRGKDPDNDVFWTTVASKMGNRRGRQQCRIKWTDALSKTVKNAGSTPRWSPQDAYILVHKIASMNVRDDSEIDWKILNDEDWNFWSAHSLQRRWLAMKRGLKGYEEMSHQEILDILCVKKSAMPSNPLPPRRSRVTSAPVIEDVQLAEAEQAHAGGGMLTTGPSSDMPFGALHPGVVFAQPGLDFGPAPPPSTLLEATALGGPGPGPGPGPGLPDPVVVEDEQEVVDETRDVFGDAVTGRDSSDSSDSSSSSSSSEEEESESSSEVSSDSSDEESSDSDSD